MIGLLCGLVIGIVMGITGAGGALVAIPLFMQFMGQNLKEASLNSLVAVVVASLLNFLSQKKITIYKTSLMIVVFSMVGSFLTAPFKENISSVWIAVIISLVSLYALYSVWFPAKKTGENSGKSLEIFWMSVIVGLSLGALTTFTGLGGGVLMLPVLLGLYRLTQPQAVATSLLAVGLSSLSSLIIQIYQGAEFKPGGDFIFLMGGIFSSVLLIKRFIRYLKPDLYTKLQQIVFTAVVLLALLKMFQ